MDVPDIPDLSLLDLFRARTFGDLSHLDSKKQLLHQKLSSTSQLDALYRFEYYTFLSEAGEVIAEMASLCARLQQKARREVAICFLDTKLRDTTAAVVS